MAAIACEACGERMNEAAVVCPHCGARRQPAGLAGKSLSMPRGASPPAPPAEPAGPPPPLASLRLSKDEIRALLATDPSLGDPATPRGLLPTLVLPHPSTSGGARAAELALTVVSFPMVVVGTLAFSLSRRRMRRKVEETTGELAPVLAMTLFGGMTMWSVLGLLGVSGTGMLLGIGGPVAALWTRAAIRSRSAGARGRDLTRVERPEKKPRPAALPAARAVTAPSEPAPRPSAPPPGPPAPPVASPRASVGTPADPAGPDDQPRLLR